MASPIEIVRPDRLVFMIGQPIIRLFASGGPGSDLGDLPRARKKMRSSMTSFDTLGCCGNMYSPADLGCCGADGMGEPWNGKPERGTWNHPGMGQANGATTGAAPTATVAAAAQAAVNQCQGLDAQISQYTSAAQAADLTDPTQAKALRTQLNALRKVFGACLKQLNLIVGPNKERLKKSGMGQAVDYAQKQTTLDACRTKVAALQTQWKNHM